MRTEFTWAVLEAVKNHPAILGAAITGSLARRDGGDEHSDLDLLLVTRDPAAVRKAPTWLPKDHDILICASHLTHYYTVLFDNFEKLDIAIFSAEDPPSNWVVETYSVIKGDDEFCAQLAKTSADCQICKAAHLNRDVCMDNVLLLLITALKRVSRGELLSAHAFLGMTADMLLSLERQKQPLATDADVLDPRRRVEKNHKEVARVLHESLFVPPDRGIKRLAEYVSTQHLHSMMEGQRRVLERLSNLHTGTAPGW